METEMMLDNKNTITMKLLHYFITEKNYNPIILQGVENEIWLENLDEDYKIVRIVSGYIHNNEQFDFDKFKTKRIMNKIKRKTLSIFKMNVASFFLNLSDNVDLKDANTKNSICIRLKEDTDLNKNEVAKKAFPDLKKKLKFTEKGTELFMKITGDINKHNQEDARKVEKVFRSKFPMVTYMLIAVNIICFLVPAFFSESNNVILDFCVHGPSIRYGQYYRLLTGTFLHTGIMHLAFNCYALYVLGSQLESYLGKAKYIVIYLVSAIFGSLFSMTFNGDTASIGASGAVFGLMGALLYFGYHYRVYLGNVIKSQILPLVIVNLLIGFLTTGVDNAAHIGGLVGGAMITMALGVKNKSSWFEEVNGCIITILFMAFTIYMAFFYGV